MAKMLKEIRVLYSDIRKWVEYVSKCYNFSEQVLHKGGLTLVAKEIFKWSSTLVDKIGKQFNKSSFK
jgi:hypothetical protein